MKRQLSDILRRASADTEHGLGKLSVALVPEALTHIARSSQGDARRALNVLEILAQTTAPTVKGVRESTLATVEEAMQKKSLLYDKIPTRHTVY